MPDQTQPVDHSQLDKFEYRVVVAGTRGFKDKKLFSHHIWRWLKDYDLIDKFDKVVFISGNAKTGADALIIGWCKKFGYRYAIFDPKWDDVSSEYAVVRVNKSGQEYNVLAGFWRNEEMAQVGNHLITFYDGESSGTRDMMTRMSELKSPVRNILVTIEE